MTNFLKRSGVLEVDACAQRAWPLGGARHDHAADDHYALIEPDDLLSPDVVRAQVRAQQWAMLIVVALFGIVMSAELISEAQQQLARADVRAAGGLTTGSVGALARSPNP